MKPNPISLLWLLLLWSAASFAQVPVSGNIPSRQYPLRLASGIVFPDKNISAEKIAAINKRQLRVRGRQLLVVQFDEMPTVARRQELAQAGISLLEYVPDNAYMAIVNGDIKWDVLLRNKARAVVELKAEQKMQPQLAQGLYPRRIINAGGTLDIWISFPGAYTEMEVREELQTRGYVVSSDLYKDYRVLALTIPAERLRDLAVLPFVEYMQAAPGADEILNNKSTVNALANVLQSDLPGGRQLTGSGVVVGVGDDANPLRHIDVQDRIINRSAATANTHGLHVTGTLAGAGIREERFKGFAPGATIVSQVFSGILANAPAYVQDHGMVITNNSYGNVVDDCLSFGVYDLYSRVMDQQQLQLPFLQHVFAAGNSGNYLCGNYVAGFGNVLGGYQTAKNVISVGTATELEVISPGSSKGPVKDGRIKPDITAQGARVYSTTPTNLYGVSSGTSMAAPAVSGGLALLYERYRQLHAGANPRNGLMKALVCNGATDLGQPGPDYSYGFGWLNLLRSVSMLENNNYISQQVNAGATNTHSFTLPAGSNIAQLKVMLYWNDEAANALAAQALINDLDLQVSGPGGSWLPQLLDTVPGRVDRAATTGEDHINNIEQVVINDPLPGTYSFQVKGTRLPNSNQYEYFLVYDTVPAGTILTYPLGGEHFQANDSIYISWESAGTTGQQVNIEFSADNGNSWSMLESAVDAATRQYKWFVPAVAATNQARIRLSNNSTGAVSQSETFVIVGVPTVTIPPVQCEGYIAINWTVVAGATDYEVMLSSGGEMRSVAITPANTYTISGLAKDSSYFVTVRARVNGAPGRRALAVNRIPSTGTCAGNISNFDLKMDAIVSPVSGRLHTASALTAGSEVIVRIKNLDNMATSGGIPVAYQLDDEAPVQATATATIAALGVYIYTFAVPVDLSAPGTYRLKTYVSYPTDVVRANDTIYTIIRQLDNPVIDLTQPLVEDMEASADTAFTTRQTGLPGLDRFDFIGSTSFGRIRTFVNSGIARSGRRALTLDADRYTAAGNVDSLTGTFNLQGVDPLTEDVRLDFMYKHHGQQSNAANQVWIRGNDQQPWLPVYDLYGNQADPGDFRRSASIEVSDLLTQAGQSFTSSFQVRWGQWGQMLAADNKSAAGYTFDDIRLYRVVNDLQLISIDTPIVASCGLGTAVPVRITLRNSANQAITSVPVRYQIDNQAVVTEIVNNIPGNSSISYTFNATANLSSLDLHQVKVWVDLAGDTFRDNDTAVVILNNSPIITNFPYLQDFESGAGNWYTAGKNSSWELGTPAAIKINRAASGQNAWKTGLHGNYNDGELSYLYSPCFDISGMTKPTLSLSIALDLEDCGTSLCDGTYIEYSGDGKTWQRLGNAISGVNWYNKNFSGNELWSVQDYTRWHVATATLPAGYSQLRLRIVMSSDPYVSKEGIAVDDIHIYDNIQGIYAAPPYISQLATQPAVAGNDWIHFTDGGKLLASVKPNGQEMGNTGIQAFVHDGAVRNYNNQYYHDRNLVITPAQNQLTDSVLVRLYFTDAETEALLAAADCSTCPRVGSAYELGVAKYSDSKNATENGSLDDNTATSWLFADPASVRKVPFDIGYYAEFKTKRFSEFWLSKGRLDNQPAPSASLSSFDVVKAGTNDALLTWVMGNEFNIDQYAIEMAKGNTAYDQNQFTVISTMPSKGNSTVAQSYTYTDTEPGKTGVRYYRIRITGIDGSVQYSAVKALLFTDELSWQVYPNPTSGSSWLVYQMNADEQAHLRIYNLQGVVVKQQKLTGNSFVQKVEIDLSAYSGGMYLFELTGTRGKKVYRVIKR